MQSSSDLNLHIMSSPDTLKNAPTVMRKYSSSEDLPIYFPKSATKKLRTKFTANSLPNSPNLTELYKRPQQRSPTRNRTEVNPVLGEIDSFISNVKMIKRASVARNLQNEFISPTKSLDVEEVNDVIKELELQHKRNEVRLKNKEEKLHKHMPANESFMRDRMWHCDRKVESVPDDDFGNRKQMYTDLESITKTLVDNFNVSNSESQGDKLETDSSSESTEKTPYEKHRVTQDMKRSELQDDFNLGMVSLAKLWSTTNDNRDLPMTFRQKLQEEKMRRQHCEQAILELQNRILELQERLSVAIQVDEAKDKAIALYRESWEKAEEKLCTVECEKDNQQQEIDKCRKQLIEEQEENAKKIANYEQEVSRALNLVVTNKEKLASIEKKYIKSQAELRTVHLNSEELQKKYSNELDKNRQYPEIIAKKELELVEIRNVLSETRKEVSQSKNVVNICQSELLEIKKENSALQQQLRTEKELVQQLTVQEKQLLQEIEAHKNIARGLQGEVTRAREQLETNKIELKNFYQGQVEIVVQNKLKEFQCQLDAAEKILKDELNKKEFSIAKMAASHIQQVSDKHSLEIKLLEEKHQEERHLHEAQVTQLRLEAQDANQKLKRQTEKNSLISKQLNKFMECLKNDSSSTDDTKSIQSKSFNNLEDILSLNMKDDRGKRFQEIDDDRNTPLTYRVAEMPLSNKTDKSAKRDESSLQTTIQMLLEKKSQSEDRHSDDQVCRDYQFFVQKYPKEGCDKPPWK